MPAYDYLNPQTGETITIIQSMSEKHTYIVDGLEWQRIWTKPGASFDTKVDPTNSKDFIKRTANRKGGTIGDLWDESKELSEKRKDLAGKDFIKENYSKNWSKQRGGKRKLSDYNKDFNIEV